MKMCGWAIGFLFWCNELTNLDSKYTHWKIGNRLTDY